MLELYIILHLILLLWILFNSFCLSKLPTQSFLTSSPLVSVLIPMRNEERNVDRIMRDIKSLTYSNLEVIILDDRSEDNTKMLVQKEISSDKRFRLIRGIPLPKGWVGKVFACHQLSLEAQGDYFLFLDADVSLHPNTIEHCISSFDNDTGLITGFPKCPTNNVLSRLLVPMQHFIVHFHLPIIIANKTKMPAFTAAHGAFMMFQREAYEAIDGHRSVKNSLVEDIHITREVKKANYYVKLMNITQNVSCYMYESNKEVWNGFSKNIYPGLGKNPMIALFLTLFYLSIFVFPFFISLFYSFSFLTFVPSLLIFAQKWIVDLVTKQTSWNFVLFPFSIITTLLVLLYSMFLHISKQGFSWKGRSYL